MGFTHISICLRSLQWDLAVMFHCRNSKKNAHCLLKSIICKNVRYKWNNLDYIDINYYIFTYNWWHLNIRYPKELIFVLLKVVGFYYGGMDKQTSILWQLFSHAKSFDKHFVSLFQNLSTFPELVKVLSHFCRSPDPDDSNALDAAVLLGKLCVADDSAKVKLKRSLHQSDDTHVKAKVCYS